MWSYGKCLEWDRGWRKKTNSPLGCPARKGIRSQFSKLALNRGNSLKSTNVNKNPWEVKARPMTLTITRPSSHLHTVSRQHVDFTQEPGTLMVSHARSSPVTREKPEAGRQKAAFPLLLVRIATASKIRKGMDDVRTGHREQINVYQRKRCKMSRNKWKWNDFRRVRRSKGVKKCEGTNLRGKWKKQRPWGLAHNNWGGKRNYVTGKQQDWEGPRHPATENVHGYSGEQVWPQTQRRVHSNRNLFQTQRPLGIVPKSSVSPPSRISFNTTKRGGGGRMKKTPTFI